MFFVAQIIATFFKLHVGGMLAVVNWLIVCYSLNNLD